MYAADMFSDTHKQVFNRKTGEWIATILVSEPEPDQPDEVQTERLFTDDRQLNLFS